MDRRFFLSTAGATAAALALDPASTAARPGPGAAVRVRPTDARYPDLISGYNNRWVAGPEEIRLPRVTEQVVRIVRDAVRAGRRITARGGGHGFEDFVHHGDVQVIVDLSLMNRVYFDERRRAFVVEAGATLLGMFETLYRGWGVTLPAGGCPSVGVGGHVLGGGYGQLSRRDGLVVDHLHAVEIVVVDDRGRARAVVATREPGDPHRDLWWACAGGGGGTLGIVTRYWFRTPGATGPEPGSLLPRPPAEVHLWSVRWPWAGFDERRFTAMIDHYGRWHERASGPDSPYADLGHWLFLAHRSAGGIGLVAQMDATRPDTEALLRRFVDGLSAAAGVEPEVLVPQRLPWLRATRFSLTADQELTNPNFRGEHKSAFLKTRFPAGQIATMYRHLSRADHDNALGQLVIASTGCRINVPSPGDTAVAHRDSIMLLLYQTHWFDPAQDERNVRWIREFYAEMYADTGGVPISNAVTGGCYVNYPDSDLGDPRFNRSGISWGELYYRGNLSRLIRVKGRWDPRDIFRHGQSIPPA